MGRKTGSSNKAKIARRVIEVLDFFDDDHREATVMDIVRRYNRPQSSTSELLSSLVELGLLRKDPYSRAYSLTPRAALLGTAGQSEMVRDGRLVRLVDRLASQLGLAVGLFAMVGTNAQIAAWRASARPSASLDSMLGGMQAPLCDVAAGWAILSAIDGTRCEGIVRRLNAEASDGRKFIQAEMMQHISDCREQRYAFGPAGFGSDAQMLGALVPRQPETQPLAIGIVYSHQDKVNPQGLLQAVSEAMRHCLPDHPERPVEKLPNAA